VILYMSDIHYQAKQVEMSSFKGTTQQVSNVRAARLCSGSERQRMDAALGEQPPLGCTLLGRCANAGLVCIHPHCARSCRLAAQMPIRHLPPPAIPVSFGAGIISVAHGVHRSTLQGCRALNSVKSKYMRAMYHAILVGRRQRPEQPRKAKGLRQL
jgi:hypothetical protein